MATKQDTQAARDPATLEVPKKDDESVGDALARVLLRPTVLAAHTVQKFAASASEKITLMGLVNELSDQVKAVHSGDMQRAETMLIAQAHSLDAIFNTMARRAHANMGEYLSAAETYLRLALKAQSQCRATLETLAAIKNPPIIYARQANVTTGPQQNNFATVAASHARETKIEPNKLLDAQNGERVEFGPSIAASGIYPPLATVGAVNWTEDERG